MRDIFFISIIAVWFLGCSETDSNTGECQNDNDCNGDRLCVDGECVSTLAASDSAIENVDEDALSKSDSSGGDSSNGTGGKDDGGLEVDSSRDAEVSSQEFDAGDDDLNPDSTVDNPDTSSGDDNGDSDDTDKGGSSGSAGGGDTGGSSGSSGNGGTGGTGECAPKAYQRCSDGIVFWYDSCGDLDPNEEPNYCPSRYACVNLTDTTAGCQCANHWEGEDCDYCPPPWDAQSNCRMCLGNYDEATDCTECRNHWEGTECKTCPGNWDPEQDCAVCVDNWGGQDCDERCVYFVDTTVTASGDGRSWENAFHNIQQGIDAAYDRVQSEGPLTNCEVWVADGFYYIYDDQQDDTVRLKRNVHVYGGFSGTETSIEQRNWIGNRSIISGDSGPDKQNHVHRVVTASDHSIIDGFTVTGSVGTGVYIKNSSPRISNCIFMTNRGIWNDNGSPVISNSLFISNTVECYSMGDVGAASAILSSGAGSVSIDHCLFTNNSIIPGAVICTGGVIAIQSGSIAITNSIFSGNTVSSIFLGAPFDFNITGKGVNCVFAGNSPNNVYFPGSFLSDSFGSFGLENCTFGGTPSEDCSGILDPGIDLDLSNLIIWSDGSSEVCAGISDTAVSNSNIQGFSSTDDGNTSGDPVFSGYPLLSGSSWTSVTYFEDLSKTRLTDSTASWSVDSLAELFVRPDADVGEDGDPRWFYIASNTETEIFVWGDISSFVIPSDSYEVYDLHLGSDSPCIDSGRGDQTDFEVSDRDIDGNLRVDDPGIEPNTGVGAPDYVDMGAYEYQP